MDNFMKINVKETNKSWTSLKNPKIYGATGKARFDKLCCKNCPYTTKIQNLLSSFDTFPLK